jgi:hypothetical protein
MKSVWNGGTYRGSYSRFHQTISSRMPPDQTPGISMVGKFDPEFAAQSPFTI